MGSKLVNEGEHRVADILFGSQAVDSAVYLGIYQDAVEPAETATIASLSEVSGSGYARKTLTRGTWVITDDYAEYAQQIFLASGGDWGDCYGYFIATSSDDSGKLLAIEHFASAYGVDDGKGIKITPKVTIA